jgi:hypothetical protein
MVQYLTEATTNKGALLLTQKYTPFHPLYSDNTR